MIDKNKAPRLQKFFRLFKVTFGFLAAILVITFYVPYAFSQNGACALLSSQIGQMLMVGFRGLSVNENSPIIMNIKQGLIGGIILFDYDTPSKTPIRNIQSPCQLQNLIRNLQEASLIPLFIAIDQEGGIVSRLKKSSGFPDTVSQQFLGKTNNPDVTRFYAEQISQTLTRLGINVNCAPVVDCNTNPLNPIIGLLERSFSENPAVVIHHADIVINALHNSNILSVIKHFPGHGSASTDSHVGFVDITDTWTARELEPFSALVKKCDMVMTAHVFNRNLDSEWPATLSERILTGILRNKLFYDGVIISDDLQMKAITSSYDLETAIMQAIIAGVDILTFANNTIYDPSIVARAHAVIEKLVREGVITDARIKQSYTRIMKLKKKLK